MYVQIIAICTYKFIEIKLRRTIYLIGFLCYLAYITNCNYSDMDLAMWNSSMVLSDDIVSLPTEKGTMLRLTTIYTSTVSRG